jgi:hypothetical protein
LLTPVVIQKVTTEPAAKRGSKHTGIPPKYAHLVEENPKVKRWHRNLKKGSVQTARSYLQALGQFCDSESVSPSEFIARGQEVCEDMVCDYIDAGLEPGQNGKPKWAGSSAKFTVAALQSWMRENRLGFHRKIKFPIRNFNPRVKTSHMPVVTELRRCFTEASVREKVPLSLMAFSGVRPMTIGTFEGSDGLRFSDFPEAHFEDGLLVFDKIPTRIVVREEICKTKIQYETFLGPEGCEYLAAYVQHRVAQEESVTRNSPVLPSERGGEFLQSESVSHVVSDVMTRAGIPEEQWPYLWRSYFDNRTQMAEMDGLTKDYRSFMMGHAGDIETIYAMRKGKGLPPDMVEQMRNGYSQALRYLETRQASASPDQMRMVRLVLLTKGYSRDDLAQLDLESKTPEELEALAAESGVTQTRPAQKVVTADELGSALASGWMYRAILPDGRTIVERA